MDQQFIGDGILALLIKNVKPFGFGVKGLVYFLRIFFRLYLFFIYLFIFFR